MSVTGCPLLLMVYLSQCQTGCLPVWIAERDGPGSIRDDGDYEDGNWCLWHVVGHGAAELRGFTKRRVQDWWKAK